MSAGDVIGKVLSYVDRPWKLLVIVILGILGGAGWFVFAERARIADMLLRTAPVSQLQPDAFSGDVQRLLRITGADAAVLMEVNLDDNLVRAKLGFDRDGKPWLPLQGQQLALYPETSMPVLFRLLRNEVVCGDATSTSVFREFQAQAAIGITRACIVAVPPLMHEMVGMLIVSWRKALNTGGEAHAGVVMTNAALKYATW